MRKVLELALKTDGARIAGCSPSLIALAADTGLIPIFGKTPRGVRVFKMCDIQKFAMDRAAAARERGEQSGQANIE